MGLKGKSFYRACALESKSIPSAFFNALCIFALNLLRTLLSLCACVAILAPYVYCKVKYRFVE